MALVPVTENPGGNICPGKFIWHDLVTPDPLLAGEFYEELFGWQVDYPGNYAVARKEQEAAWCVLPQCREAVAADVVSVPAGLARY